MTRMNQNRAFHPRYPRDPWLKFSGSPIGTDNQPLQWNGPAERSLVVASVAGAGPAMEC